MGDLTVVTWLVEHGADVNAKDNVSCVLSYGVCVLVQHLPYTMSVIDGVVIGWCGISIGWLELFTRCQREGRFDRRHVAGRARS